MNTFAKLKEWEISISEAHSKYEIGKGTDAFEDIKDLKPVFSFDYVSMRNGFFCFNGKTLGRKDYIKLIKALKDVSLYTYETMNVNFQF